MKYILLLLSIFSLQTINAQKRIVQVSVQGKTIEVNLDDENPTNTLAINTALPSTRTGKLKIVNKNWQTEKEWKRTFSIYSNTDVVIATVKPCKSGSIYELSLKTFVSKIVKGETYSLYTIAIPKDPKKAALVRVRRVLVCTITIK
jgi:hypothetical protein